MCDKVEEEWGEVFQELAKGGDSYRNNIDLSLLFKHIQNACLYISL